MERWEEIQKGLIPKENYQVSVQNSEEFGLSIKLVSKKYNVNIFFGAGASLRMLEEGIVSPEIFQGDSFVYYQNQNFSNTIYRIENGEFGNMAKNVSEDLFELLGVKHYVLFTMNYVIEIITEWEPEIEVIEKG